MVTWVGRVLQLKQAFPAKRVDGAIDKRSSLRVAINFLKPSSSKLHVSWAIYVLAVFFLQYLLGIWIAGPSPLLP